MPKLAQRGKPQDDGSVNRFEQVKRQLEEAETAELRRIQQQNEAAASRAEDNRVARDKALAERKVQTIEISVPMADPGHEEGRYQARLQCEVSIDYLTRPQQEVLRRLYAALELRGERLPSGRPLRRQDDCLLWLLEQVALQMPELNELRAP
jgi:hypothetical protein